MMRHAIFLTVLLALVMVSAATAAADEPANANIERLITGQYTYRTTKARRLRGYEDWMLTVHPDGSRTMMALVNNLDADVQFNMVHRVDGSFRPLETYITHWVGGESRGSGHFVVDGRRLRATVTGQVIQTIEVPDQFSMHPHPVATDSWRGWEYDTDRGGVQTFIVYNVAVAPNAPAPLLGVLEDQTFEWLGSETITVPAGTFDTDHYKLRGNSDMWIAGPDRIAIKYMFPELDREYVLTEYASNP
jgi:hypothetical protein